MPLHTGKACDAFKFHIEGAAERDPRPLRKFSSAGSIVEIGRNKKEKGNPTLFCRDCVA